MPHPEVDAATTPWVTVAEMAEIDRVMVDGLGITLVQMMENAGRGVAVLARHLLGGAAGRRVRVLAGTGGNGGGGLAAARHLHVAGADVAVTVSAHPPADSATAAQLGILQRLGLPLDVGANTPDPENDLTVDALLGYGQNGPPRGPVAALMRSVGNHPVLALDVPSGLELATGSVHEPAVRAAATLTLAAPKHGLEAHPAHVGALYLADISVPSAVLDPAFGASWSNPFGDGPLVRLRWPSRPPEPRAGITRCLELPPARRHQRRRSPRRQQQQPARHFSRLNKAALRWRGGRGRYRP